MASPQEVTNLITDSSINLWSPVNFSPDQGNWQSDDDTIKQTELTTTSKSASGTALLHPDHMTAASVGIVLKLFPGSQYLSGLVFNYLDDLNFFLYVINQFSSTYQGHRVQIVKVADGDASILFDEKYDEDLAEDQLLLIEFFNDGLVFYKNYSIVTRIEDASFNVGQLGLYSQQNSDAIFKVLAHADASLAPDQPEPADQTTLESEEVFTNQVLPPNDFERYLTINPPAAETQVEFHELFVVPLDSFYVSLFQNTKLAGTEVAVAELPGIAAGGVENSADPIQVDLMFESTEGAIFDETENSFYVWEMDESSDEVRVKHNVYTKSPLALSSTSELDLANIEAPLGQSGKNFGVDVLKETVMLDISSWQEAQISDQIQETDFQFGGDNQSFYFSDDTGFQFGEIASPTDFQQIASIPGFKVGFFQPVNGRVVAVYDTTGEDSKSVVALYDPNKTTPFFEVEIGNSLYYTSFIFSNTEKYFLIGSSSFSYLYDLDTNSLHSTFGGNYSLKNNVDFTEDDQYLFIVHSTMNYRFSRVNLGNDTEFFELGETIKGIRAIDENTVLLVLRNRIVKYNLLTESIELEKDIDPNDYDIYNFGFWELDKANNRFVIQYSSKVYLVELSTLNVLDEVYESTGTQVRLSPDKTKIIGSYSVWKIESDNTINEVNILSHLPNNSNVSTISENGSIACATSHDGKEIIVLNLETGQILNAEGNTYTYTIKSHQGVGIKDLSSDGTKLIYTKNMSSYYLSDGSNKVLFDLLVPNEDNFFPLLQTSPDNKFATIYNGEHKLRILDIESGAITNNLGSVYGPWTSDSSHLILMDSSGYNVRIRNFYSGDEHYINVNGRIGNIKSAVDANIFAFLTTAPEVSVWNLSTRQVIFQKQLNFNSPESLSLSSDGSVVGCQKSEGIYALFSVVDGNEISSFEVPTKPMWASFTPEGSRIVVVLRRKIVSHAVPQHQQVTPDKITNLTRTFQLDYRPKDWYRAYKHANDEESLHLSLATNYQELIATHKTWTGLAHEEIEEHLQKLSSYNKAYQKSQELVYEARDLKHQILHLVRTNQYGLLEVTSDGLELQNAYRTNYNGVNVGQDLNELGYDFAIIKGQPKFKDHQPIRLDANIDFSNDEQWKIFADDFQERLFATTAVSEEKKLIFRSERGLLQDFESNTALVNDREKNVTDKENAMANKQLHITRDTTLQNDIDAWSRDKAKLVALHNGYNRSLSGVGKINEFVRFYNQVKARTFERVQITGTMSTSISYRKAYAQQNLLEFAVGVIFGSGPKKVDVQITNYNYTIEHLLFDSNKPNVAFTYIDDQREGASTSFSITTLDYFMFELDRVIQSRINSLDRDLKTNETDLKSLDEKIAGYTAAIKEIDENALAKKRKEFIRYWNDPSEFGALDLLDDPIQPDSDPIADLLEMLREEFRVEQSGKDIQLDYFNHNGQRFYNQDGLSMPAYLQFLKTSSAKHVAFFPSYNEDGTQNTSLYRAVVNPRAAFSRELKLPRIKFVETYTVRIKWKGPHLGELSHTENLFPGESKEIIVEKSTELTRQLEQSRSETDISTAKTTSSFEENLSKELTLKETSEQEKEDSYKDTEKETHEESLDIVTKDKKHFDLNVDFGGKGGLLSSVLGAGGKVESKLKLHKDKNVTDKKKDTFERSKEREGKMSNKESREAFSKNVQNTIKKVVSETSQENKVEVKVNVSEEFSQKSSSKETLTIENPNQGRTVNYNFFQVQNQYEVLTYLTDVKIVVDPNEELIKGSGSSDVRIYDLEELGKIFPDSDTDDNKTIVTCGIIARQVFKNYLGSVVEGVGQGNGALGLPDTYTPDLEKFNALFFSRDSFDPTNYEEELITSLRNALNYLKSVPFQFQEVAIHANSTHSVNAGAYYLDSEVGKQPATEQYLEDRRDIETQRKIAELEHLNAQTEAKVFYRDLPGSVTSLDLGSEG